MNNLSQAYIKGLEDNDDAAFLKEFDVGVPAPAPETPAEAPVVEPKKDESIVHAVGSFIKELPEQALGGVFDAINNTTEAARSIGKAIGIPNYALQITNPEGQFDPMFLDPAEVERRGGLHSGIISKVPDAKTAAGGFTRALTNFAAGFIPVSKGLKAVGVASNVVRGMTAGAVADAVVTDPHQARLSTLMNEVPVLGQIIPDYIADNNPANESEWEGRIKNVLEGIVVGGAAEVTVGAATKLFKAYKVHANAPPTPKDATATIAEDFAASEAKAQAFADSPMGQGVEKDFGSHGMEPETLLTKTPEGKTYFNYGRINTAEDVQKVMGNMLDDVPSDGVMSLSDMKTASKEEYRNIAELMGREVNTPFTPSQAVAARELLNSSAENITELAKIASNPMASPEDMFRFRKAVEVHGAMQEVVVAGRKATARSLKSWDIRTGSSVARAKQVAALLEQQGAQNKDLARMIAETAEAGGNVSGVIGKTLSGKFADAYYQVWINGLLSSPQTHAANAVSNMATTLMAIPERYITAGFDALKGAGGESMVAANARATGFFGGLQDGWRLLKGSTEDSVLASSSKLERQTDSISAAAWGKSPDSTVGKGLDYLGKAIGMPGWALEKGDNFFKGLNYRMRLQESAAQTALEEGLTGKAFKERVADLVANPTSAMEDISSDFARYQTFTNEAGPFAKSVGRLAYSTPGGRYVIPFVRTPANILSYGFERTPLAFAMSKTREALKAGGARQSEAMARMAAGSLLMASVVPFTMDGKITGGGPADVDQRKLLEQTGWKPYSVKIGDNYVSYDRMEPISSLIGYSADIAAILGQLGEDESGELVAAGLAAFSKSLTNKTFLSGVTNFVETVTSNSPGKWSNFTSRMASGFIQPVYSSAIKKGNNYFDPIARDYRPDDENGYLKSIILRAQENIPGMGTSSPPLTDIWGDDLRYDNGVAPALETISPIKIYKEDKDPVNKMIADNKVAVSMPSRNIMGIKLTNREYYEYSKTAGNIAREIIDGAYKDGTFDNASDGPDGEKALIVKQILTKARAAAQKELIWNNPEIEERIMAYKRDKQKKLIGE